MRSSSFKWMFLFIVAVVLAGCGSGAEVETVEVRRGTIREYFMEPARTHLESRMPVPMPVSGRVERIVLQPGDAVRRGERLALVDLVPFETAAGEIREQVEQLEAQLELVRDDRVEKQNLENAQAQAAAAAAQRDAAERAVEEQDIRAARLQKEYERLTQLSGEAAIPDTLFDDAQADARMAEIAAQRARHEVEYLSALYEAAASQARVIEESIERKELEARVLENQVAQARERLRLAEHRLELAQFSSPIDGVVLQRYELGGGPIMEGTPVFLLGNLDDLEVEADVLTQDAVRLAPGSPVEYTVVSGQPPLHGVVIRVEPAAFTKLSSLGVEQQRVRVISSLDERPENLGYGFRLQTRYYKGEADNALIVPRSAVMQAPDASYFVYAVRDGRIVREAVSLGLRSDFEIQIVEGLSENDQVVSIPDTTIREGQRVR